MVNTRAVGRAGEDAAYNYLTRNGYRILYRNFRYRKYGEIDLIAQKSGYICFIEVKSRSGASFGTPAEAINFTKRKKILTVANHYIKVCRIREQKLRFDVVEVFWDREDPADGRRVIKWINHIENAFGV